MTFIDIHTHNCTAENAIFNSSKAYVAGKNISMGIHPWEIDGNWECEFAAIAEFAKAENVVAIGECGFDTLKSPATLELQERIFRRHAGLAEEMEKPLIIHCVKAFDTLIALHKELSPKQTWIIHGFRGKPQMAEQLSKAGFHISLGEKFNTESARAIPTEQLFIESDESRCPIADIYAAIAVAKGVSTEDLARQLRINSRIFRQF